jgi:hypothetical protein
MPRQCGAALIVADVDHIDPGDTMSIFFALIIVAFVLSLLAAIGVPAGRISLFPLAFAVYMLALILTK